MRRIAIVVIAAVVIAAIGVFAWRIFGPGPLAFAGGSTVALTDYREANPTGVPADLAKADPIRRGEYLAKAADCMVCHTMPGGEAFAGGLAFPLPFGTLYSTNITPDNETGIGNYTDQDFLNAVRQGIRKDGARLYPAMPYTRSPEHASAAASSRASTNWGSHHGLSRQPQWPASRYIWTKTAAEICSKVALRIKCWISVC